MVYVLIYLLVGTAGFLYRYNFVYWRYKNGTVKRMNAFFLASFILLVLIASLRTNNVGVDTKSYVGVFELFAKGNSIRKVSSYATTVEKGYLIFCKLISMFSSSSIFFLLCHSMIIYGCFLKYILKNSENAILSMQMLVSLFFTSTLNIMRQYLAFAFVLYALDAFAEKKYEKTAILFLIGVLIHKTSLLFVPCFLIYLWKSKADKLFRFTILVVVIGKLISNVTILNRILTFFGYRRYINSIHMMAADSGGRLAYIYLLIVLAGFVVVFMKKQSIDDDFCFYLMLSEVGTMFALMAKGNEMFARVGMCYLFFIIMLFPMIVNRVFSNTKRRLWILSVISIFLIAASYLTGSGYSYSMVEIL